MKNMLAKNTLRCALRTKGRFISIMAIIAIGCAFFSGVKASCPYMKSSAREYFDTQKLSDICIRSTLGFNDDDIAAIAACDETAAVRSGYSAELFLKNRDESLILTVYSYDPDADMDKLVLEEGRLPANDGECLMDYSLYKGRSFGVGEKIHLTGEDSDDISDVLNGQDYTICGLVRSPMYVSFERGAASVGNGTINGYLYIPENNFAYEYRTDLYITGEGLADIDPFTGAYEERADYLKEYYEDRGEERLAVRCDDIRSEAEEELDKARNEIADAEREYDNAEKAYQDGVEKYESGKKELENSRREYERGVEEYKAGKSDLDRSANALKAVSDGCSYAESCLDVYAESYLPSLPEGMRTQLNEMQDGLDKMGINIALKDMIAIYVTTPPEGEEGKQKERDALVDAIAQVRTAYSGILSRSEAASGTFEEAKEQLRKAKKEIKKGEKQLEESERTLNESKEKLDDARKKIDDGKAEIAEKEQELEDRLSEVKWYVFTRADYYPYYSHYGEDADRVDAIAKVFPIFFILVAALVCVCTMTRMVEEQRTEMGTLKALGCSDISVTGQFVGYAAAASVIGSAIGVPVGIYTIPRVIFIAYQTMYQFPNFSTPMRWDYFFGCMAASLLCTGLSAFIAQKGTSAEVPASLMRPRPPVNGRRIFLERAVKFWRRLSFTQKVTFRNLFRYKVKLLMTVLGVAGCTALLLTGFGLRYAVSSIVDRQFVEIFLYDAAAACSDDITEEGSLALGEMMDASENISEYMKVSQRSADVFCGSKRVEQCYIFAPEDGAPIGNYISLRERNSDVPLEMSDSGVIINEKLAVLLEADVGSMITIEGGAFPVSVAGITENYANNYVYMTQNTCEELFGEFKPELILINMADGTDPDRLSRELIAQDGVLGVSMSAEGGNKFRKLVGSLDLVVVVIIAFSGALATVILFNLASINLTERIRELATIKVLGFFNGEVTAYIIRENLISTAMGMAVGLVLGMILESFVVRTAEVDVVMFAHDIAPYCFGAAAGITFAFAMLVNFIMHFRMKKIDMAASLKAAE